MLFIPQGAKTYNHDNAIISDGGDGLKITHNTLLDQVAASKGASSSIGLYEDSGAVTNVTISNNFIAGGAYALYPGGTKSKKVVVKSNAFSTMFWRNSGIYGPVAKPYWHTGFGNVWSGNTWADGQKPGRR